MFTEENGVKSEWFFAMGHKLKQNSITNDIMSSNQHWYIATHTILYSVCLVDHFSTLPTLPVATPLVSLACQSGRLPTPNLSASKTRLPSNRTLSSWKTRYWTSGNHAELRITHGWVSASYNIYIYIYIHTFLYSVSFICGEILHVPQKGWTLDFRMTNFRFWRQEGCLSSCLGWQNDWIQLTPPTPKNHNFNHNIPKSCPKPKKTTQDTISPSDLGNKNLSTSQTPKLTM